MATATASAGPGPVGYLVNHPGGLAGVHGIGYDYVLGSRGVYVQSESAHLTARVPVAACDGAGARSRDREGAAHPRPHPGNSSSWGCAGSRTTPDTERFFAVRWDGDATGWWCPRRPGLRTRLAYVPPAGVVAEFHSHGGSRAFFSATDDRDEQGFRIYGVVGRLDALQPELSLRVGVYGHFAPLDWPQVFDGPNPGLRLMGQEAETADINCKGGE